VSAEKVTGPLLPRHPDAPLGIVQAFRASVERYPERRALVCRGRELTYSELARAVLGLGARLRSLGVRGRRVVVAMPTSIEAVVAVLGVLAAGAQVVPINPFFTRPELEVVLREARAELVIIGVEASDKLRALAPTLGFGVLGFDGAAPELALSSWLGAGELDWAALDEPGPEERAVAILTGGTTGEPKAVEHTHGSLFVSVLQHCAVWRVRPGLERFLSAAPIFHIWGLFYATFVPLYAGGTLVLVPRYDPDEVLTAIAAEKITVFGGGPAPVYLGLMSSPLFNHTDFSSLVYCLSGGAPCPLELHQRWRAATGCALLEGWGMSEAAPLCLTRPEAPKPMSVGRAVPETAVEVVDLEDGERVLADGEAGEIRVRGPQVMLGYAARPEATEAILREGWLYTGDIGYLDAEGDLFLVDRKKDMIIVGGYNVYPRQVDEVLYRHPAIAEAATVGRADERLGEVLVAFVVKRPGAALDETEFFEFCRAELVKYRRPVEVTFLDALPRTNARKVDKRALRAQAERAHAPPASASPDA
jgi:long-chain acyl-CoA synthetase